MFIIIFLFTSCQYSCSRRLYGFPLNSGNNTKCNYTRGSNNTMILRVIYFVPTKHLFHPHKGKEMYYLLKSMAINPNMITYQFCIRVEGHVLFSFHFMLYGFFPLTFYKHLAYSNCKFCCKTTILILTICKQ